MELDPILAKAYARTFIPRFDRYPLQRSDGRYVQIKKPLTNDLILAHLTNHHTGRSLMTLGAYALSPESMANWICFDADTDEQWEGLWRLAHNLQREAIQVYLEPSRRGGHLWLFTCPITGAEARAFGKHLLTKHNLTDMEVFPKQDKLAEGAGSFVRLPLGVHRKTGKVYPFLDVTGQPIATTIREQIFWLTEPIRLTRMYIDRILPRSPQGKLKILTPEFKPRAPVAGDTLSETIKNTISVEEFVRQYVELDQQGKGHCPFHDDQVKSFQVNTGRNYWNCYAGCGGGSVINFWMKWRETHSQDGSFTATIKDLREILLQ